MKKIILTALVLLLLVYAVSAATVSHNASQVKPGTFQAGQYNFPDNLTVDDYVGIGTASPTEKLHIAGNLKYTGSIRSGEAGEPGRWRFYDYSGYLMSFWDTGSDYDTWGLNWDTSENEIQWMGNGNLRSSVDLDDGSGYFQGNVGIGTTAPTQKLDVNGSANVSSSLYLPTLASASCDVKANDTTGKLYCGADATVGAETWVNESGDTMTGTLNINKDDIAFEVSNSSGGRAVRINTTSGKTEFWSPIEGANDFVSIYHDGTTGYVNAASGELRMMASGQGLIWSGGTLYNGAANGIDIGTSNYEWRGLYLGEDATSGAYFGLDQDWRIWNNGTTNKLSIDTGTTNVITIENVTGNVGIGTTSPLAPLHIVKNNAEMLRLSGYSGDPVNYYLSFIPTVGAGTVDYTFRVNDNTVIKDMMFFDSSAGNVGIGTTTPSHKLNVVGDANITSSIYSGALASASCDVKANDTTGKLYCGADSTGSDGWWPLSSDLINTSNVLYINWTKLNATIDARSDFDTNTNCSVDGSCPLITYDSERAWNKSGSYVYLSNTSNYVGIGTTGPNAKLDILGDNNQLRISTSGTYSSIYFYNGAANSMGIYTNGMDTHFENRGSGALYLGGAVNQNHLTILNGGNVGIGTTAPTQKLDVNGSANVSSSLYLPTLASASCDVKANDTTGKLYCGADSTGSDGWWPLSSDLINTSNVLYLNWSQINSTIDARSDFDTDTNTNCSVDNSCPLIAYDSELAWNKSGSYVYLSNTSQSVGIGTTSPATPLHVNTGAATGAPEIRIGPTNVASTGALEFSNAHAKIFRANNYIQYEGYEGHIFGSTQGSTHEMMRIQQNGNVGIGMTNPTAKLHVNGSVNVTSGNDVCIEGGNCLSSVSGGGGASHWNRTGSNVYLNDTSNNVGIGTTSPSTKLDVLGSDTLPMYVRTSDAAAYMRFLTGSTTSRGAFGYDSTGALFLNAALNTTNMVILDGGNVGIGITNPTHDLDVSGTVYMTGDAIVDGAVMARSFGTLDMMNNDVRIGAYSGKSIIFGAGSSGAEFMRVASTGNVGIGTAAPSQKLDVNGSANITGNLYLGGNITSYGADFAEMMSQDENLSAGDVVCLTENMNVQKCTQHAQNSVAGVVSEKPTIMGNAEAENAVPVGIVGIVTTKVKGPIEQFDLLTTSATPGHAEKASAEDFGAIIGKAMEPCSDVCEIKVLVGLR